MCKVSLKTTSFQWISALCVGSNTSDFKSRCVQSEDSAKMLNYSSTCEKFMQVLLILRVSSLSDDPSKLHLSPGVDLKPVVSLFCLRTPRTAIHVLIVVRSLKLTRALLRPQFLSHTYIPCVRGYDELYDYLHVEPSSLGREAMMRLWGGQQLVVFHPVGLQTQRRTLWEGKANKHMRTNICLLNVPGRFHTRNMTSALFLGDAKSTRDQSLPVILILLGSLGTDICFSLSSSSSSHCFLSRSASACNEKTTCVKTRAHMDQQPPLQRFPHVLAHCAFIYLILMCFQSKMWVSLMPLSRYI